jgi:hypothetical protein
MFTDMLDAIDQGTAPMETFYDGYVVNAVMDACYRSAESRQWEPILLDVWRGAEEVEHVAAQTDYDEQHSLIKSERMPDGRTKLILRDKATGQIVQRIE